MHKDRRQDIIDRLIMLMADKPPNSIEDITLRGAVELLRADMPCAKADSTPAGMHPIQGKWLIYRKTNIDSTIGSFAAVTEGHPSRMLVDAQGILRDAHKGAVVTLYAPVASLTETTTTTIEGEENFNG